MERVTCASSVAAHGVLKPRAKRRQGGWYSTFGVDPVRLEISCGSRICTKSRGTREAYMCRSVAWRGRKSYLSHNQLQSCGFNLQRQPYGLRNCAASPSCRPSLGPIITRLPQGLPRQNRRHDQRLLPRASEPTGLQRLADWGLRLDCRDEEWQPVMTSRVHPTMNYQSHHICRFFSESRNYE